eukprot:m51a1_g11223 hypothetical protein (136) ;mRNA; f:13546-14108
MDVQRGALAHEWAYLDVSMQSRVRACRSARGFRSALADATRALLGTAGTALPLDMLAFDPEGPRALVRVPRASLSAVWAALAMANEWEGEECRIEVGRVTGSALSCVSSSRDLERRLLASLPPPSSPAAPSPDAL